MTAAEVGLELCLFVAFAAQLWIAAAVWKESKLLAILSGVVGLVAIAAAWIHGLKRPLALWCASVGASMAFFIGGVYASDQTWLLETADARAIAEFEGVEATLLARAKALNGSSWNSVSQSGPNSVTVTFRGTMPDPALVRAFLGRVGKFRISPFEEGPEAEGEETSGVPGDRVIVGNAEVEFAKPDFDPLSRPIVSARLNLEGGRAFAAYTEKNIGEKIALVLDDEVLTAPEIRSRVSSRFQVQGEFSAAEAMLVAACISSAPLPTAMTPRLLSGDGSSERD